MVMRTTKWTLIMLLLPVMAVAEESSQHYLQDARGYATQLLQEAARVRNYEISLVGHADTIYLCSMTAAGISSEISCDNNILIRRVSPDPRNIGNSSLDSWEQKAFAQLHKQHRHTDGFVDHEFYEVVSEPMGNYYRYMRSIKMTAECLPCHGAEGKMEQDVLAALNKHYPYDGARDYEIGSLVGAISVKISMKEKPLFARPPKE